ncbi:hypothetical protein HAX54_047032 [Datura stramonium]|uniref:RNase H type-1 domain-containing protein n=1 Tax=Datura stramonium TaxID=4076 RepID=A0ABS8WK79_DATST|nr:hypothetical protein [Datura stramonium]
MGFFKLNVDGTFSYTNNSNGIGGVIRDSNDDWIVGYLSKCNAQNHTLAELKALEHGLLCIISHKISPIEIETDSIEALKHLGYTNQLYESTVISCSSLLRGLRNPPIRHSFCQANKVAHVLSRQVSKLTTSSQDTILVAPPSHVKDQLRTNKEGAISSKLVSVATCNKLACFGNLSVVTDNNNVHITTHTSTT